MWAVDAEIKRFAEQHPDIDELRPLMAWCLRTETAECETLDDAYKLAKSLHSLFTPLPLEMG